MIRWLNLLLCTAVFSWGGDAADVPEWVIRGIAGVESSSFYDAHGAFVYVNQRRGRHGERGPWQMTRSTFKETMGSTTEFLRLQSDVDFAEAVARQRLWDLRVRVGSWDGAVRAWNAGVSGALRGRGTEYLRDVKRWVRRFDPEYAQ